MRRLFQEVCLERTLLGDGAMGTELQQRGLPINSCPEQYNISHPDLVRGIYLDYFNAGSDIIETNSFGANRARLQSYGHEGFPASVSELNRRAAELAREVCPEGCFVGGCVGPTGEIIEPLGHLSLVTAYSIFAEQIEALAEGGVDVIYIDTMSAPEEAEIAIRVVKDRTSLPVIASMTFKSGKRGMRTAWGTDVPTVVQRLTDFGADIIGANCGVGPEEMVKVIAEMRRLTTKPIIAQPNAGIPEWVGGIPTYSLTPEGMRPYAKQLLELGVNILAGCCGTNPAHIRMMRELIDA